MTSYSRLGSVLTAFLIGAAPLAAQESAAGPVQFPTRKSLGVDIGYVSFAGDIDPWTLAAVSLGTQGTSGSIIGRVNVANRFGTTGAQYEADAYPSLGKSTYGYLNLGYSSASIFPEWRWGAEVFQSLPNAYEASLGVRQLRFGGAPVTLFTGSVGKYVGNYWFSARPYLRSKDGGLSASAGFTARRYYEDRDNYVGARVSYGTTPSDRVIATELLRTSSFSAGIHGSRGLAPRVFGTWSLGYEREELSATRVRNRYEVNAGARVDF